MIQEKSSQALIEIDGGVNQQNAGLLLQAGADILVAGNFVFSAANPKQTIASLKAMNVGQRHNWLKASKEDIFTNFIGINPKRQACEK